MVNRLEWEGKKVPFVSYKGSLLSNANKKGSYLPQLQITHMLQHTTVFTCCGADHNYITQLN